MTYCSNNNVSLLTEDEGGQVGAGGAESHEEPSYGENRVLRGQTETAPRYPHRVEYEYRLPSPDSIFKLMN